MIDPKEWMPNCYELYDKFFQFSKHYDGDLQTKQDIREKMGASKDKILEELTNLETKEIKNLKIENLKVKEQKEIEKIIEVVKFCAQILDFSTFNGKEWTPILNLCKVDLNFIENKIRNQKLLEEKKINENRERLRKLSTKEIIDQILKRKEVEVDLNTIIEDWEGRSLDEIQEIKFYTNFVRKYPQSNLRSLTIDKLIKEIQSGLEPDQLEFILRDPKWSKEEKHLLFLENFFKNYHIPSKNISPFMLLKMIQEVGFSREYANLIGCTTYAFNKRMNNDKNRYGNIFPADLFRILLPSDKEGYINASFFSNKHIAAQGPRLNKEDFEDFLEMCLNHETDVILSLGKPVEKGRDKFDEWFNENNPEVQEFNEVSKRYQIEFLPFEDDQKIHYFNDKGQPVGGEEKSDYTLRRIKITDKLTKESKIISHTHYHNIPDHGNPTAEGFANIINELRGKRVVSHCSAGVGRTGIFLSYLIMEELLSGVDPKELGIDIGMTSNEIKGNPEEAVLRLVSLLRLRRSETVQMEKQFQFLIDRFNELIAINKKEELQNLPVEYQKVWTSSTDEIIAQIKEGTFPEHHLSILKNDPERSPSEKNKIEIAYKREMEFQTLPEEEKKIRKLTTDEIIDLIRNGEKIDMSSIINDPYRTQEDMDRIKFFRMYSKPNSVKRREEIESLTHVDVDEVLTQIKGDLKLTELELKYLLSDQARSFAEKQLIFLEYYLKKEKEKELLGGFEIGQFAYLDDFQEKALSDDYKNKLGCTTVDFTDNMLENRYSNVGPTDFGRVLMEFFINASQVSKRHIATQGPFLDPPEKFEKFLKMCITSKTDVIVTLGKHIENDFEKFDEWFNEEKLEKFNENSEEFSIELVPFDDKEKVHYFDKTGNKLNSIQGSEYAKRNIRIIDKRTGQEIKTISHLEYHNIPDHSTPDPLGFVAATNELKDKNIVCHCSAGIGRTGIFLSYLIMAELISGTDPNEVGINIGMKADEIKNNPEEAVMRLVWLLRLRRPGIIQTDEQLQFLIKQVEENFKT